MRSDIPDIPERVELSVWPAVPERRDRLATPDSRVLPESRAAQEISEFKVKRDYWVHKVRPVVLEMLVTRARSAFAERPATGEASARPATRASRASRAKPAALATRGPPGTAERPEKWDTPERPAARASSATPERRDSPGHRATRVGRDRTASAERTARGVRPERPDSPERPETAERSELMEGSVRRDEPETRVRRETAVIRVDKEIKDSKVCRACEVRKVQKGILAPRDRPAQSALRVTGAGTAAPGPSVRWETRVSRVSQDRWDRREWLVYREQLDTPD